jgi:V8-like Glu-specific endopeptidase
MRAGLIGCLLVACAPARPFDLASRSDEILAGTADAVSTSVFFVISTFNNGKMGFCTGTLITSRVILTAGHCVDPSREGAESVVVRVMNQPNDQMLMMSDLRNVAQIRRHPNYSGQGANDLALLQLETAISGVTPELLVRTPPSSYVGQAIRVVGYGRTSPSGPSDTGTRRTVNTTIARSMPETFEFGQAGSLGICAGDSGGPSFWRSPDGMNRVAGVHSYGTTTQCGVGGDVRVDTELSFIDATLAVFDPPACGADGRCQMGCTPADPDCTCIADGRCEACMGAVDPDCPANCITNDICQNTDCPVPDPDCKLDGEVCTELSECAGNRCLADPRRFSFCSRTCVDDTVCSRAMVCIDGACRAAPGQLISGPGPVEPVIGGCSTSGSLTLLPAFILLVARRSRRCSTRD